MVCISLEGLPLAIELAAARADTLSPGQMSVLLMEPDSPLQLLTGGARDLPIRQRTLRSAVQWSYNLLDEDEKCAFRRFGVFVGGFTPEAVQAVGGDVSADLRSLANKSLVNSLNDDGNAKGLRFGMFEVVREFACDRLRESGEEETTRRKHARYYLDLAQQASPQLSGPDQAVWLTLLEKEHPNIRTALSWALAAGFTGGSEGRIDRLEMALQFCVALWQFWMYHGHVTEGRDWFKVVFNKITSLVGSEEVGIIAIKGYSATLPSLWAKALRGAGVLAFQQGDYDVARSMAEQSLILHRELGDIPGVISALNGLGSVAQTQGDFTAARHYLLETLQMARQLGDDWRIAILLSNLGVIECELQDFAAARTLHEEALALSQAANDTYAMARALNNLGNVARYQRDHVAARSYLGESLQLQVGLENKRGMAYSLINLGHVARDEGSYEEGLGRYREALALLKEIGDKGIIAECLEGIAGIVGMLGKSSRAVTLFGSASALREAVAVPISPAERPIYEQYLSAAHEEISEEDWLVAWREGQTMSLDDALLLALGQMDDSNSASPPRFV